MVARTDLDELRRARAAIKATPPDSWWYYAKKAVPLYPGVSQAAAPDFLKPYYRAWQGRLGAGRKLLNAAVLSAFRAWVPRRARRIAQRYGLDESWRANAIRQARAHVVDPNELALFRIHRDEDLAPYLRSFEWAEITKRINPRQWDHDCVLAHKIDFHLHAEAHGLPVPLLHATVRNGDVTMIEPSDAAQLVCKPDSGRGGQSVFILKRDGAAPGDTDALVRELAAHPRLREGEWLVQEHVRVHPDLRALGMSALPTVRLITMLNESGEPEILVTYLRFPSDPDAEVDNFFVGGLMGIIDPATGMMGTACIKRDLADHDVHPVSGAAIAGVRIPYWPETKALVKRAHREAFADYAMVGWDIGVTETGPVIVEANGKPCAQGAQMAMRKGLGETRFGELIAWHLAQITGSVGDR